MNSVPAALRVLAGGLTDPDRASAVVAGRPGTGGRPAAVLILLSEHPGAARPPGLELVLVEKRADLRKHAGQLAFPGGAIEPSDPDVVAAALREADEEVGVDPPTVQVLGILPPAHVYASGFDVTGVVGRWLTPRPLRPVDLSEVAAVHRVAVADLVDPDNRSTWLHPRGFSGPAFVLGELYVWGFTAHLIDGLLTLAGWSLPWDAARTSAIPPRFLHGRR